MKKTFPGYYRPDDEEFKMLWKDCLFVFDTNVLRNLYRYSSETTNDFLELLDQISDRIWLPHQAGYEYQKGRLDEIAIQEKSYDDLIGKIDKTEKNLKASLQSRIHPFLKDADELIEKLSNIFDEIKSRLKEKKEEYVFLTAEDNVKNRLTSLFEGKVGSAYSETELEKIYKEGKKRYDRRIPPGYKDAKKPEPERYGDLILWFQTIAKGKSENQPIILVTDENKEDWWLFDSKEKRIGPHPELINEMTSEAKVPFYIYRADPFMENARKYLTKDINQKAIDEIREVRERDEELLKEEMRLSDEVRAEIFRPSASDAVKALQQDAINPNYSLAELMRNMDAMGRLRDAITPSEKLGEALVKDIRAVGEFRGSSVHPFLPAELIKNLDALGKLRDALGPSHQLEEILENADAVSRIKDIISSGKPEEIK